MTTDDREGTAPAEPGRASSSSAAGPMNAFIREEYNRQKAPKDVVRHLRDSDGSEIRPREQLSELRNMQGKPVRLTWTEVTEDVDGIPMSVETVVEDGVYLSVFNRRYPDA